MRRELRHRKLIIIYIHQAIDQPHTIDYIILQKIKLLNIKTDIAVKLSAIFAINICGYDHMFGNPIFGHWG